jgi:hypothetical protein
MFSKLLKDYIHGPRRKSKICLRPSNMYCLIIEVYCKYIVIGKKNLNFLKLKFFFRCSFGRLNFGIGLTALFSNLPRAFARCRGIGDRHKAVSCAIKGRLFLQVTMLFFFHSSLCTLIYFYLKFAGQRV